MTIRNLLFIFKHKRACKRLLRDVERRKASFETEQFRRRRAAALKRVPKVWAS
jgi:hypothetical protein